VLCFSTPWPTLLCVTDLSHCTGSCCLFNPGCPQQ
jgi:hypothetical protein